MIGSCMRVGTCWQKSGMRITLLRLLSFTVILMLIVLPAQAYTTEVQVVKFASDSISIINETTINYSWMEANLPVYGDGMTHYYHQGPTFDPSNLWDPGEIINIESRDFGAAQGTDVKDLCELVGGMAAGDWVKIKASDGFFKSFDYDDVYLPEPQLGRMVIAWYNPTYGGYPPAYDSGLRLIFFANTTNPAGKYVFGNWDMHETLAENRWHYYYGSGTLWPSSSGLSVYFVNRLEIYSRLAAPKISIIEILPATAVLFVGDTKQFGVSARDQYNSELPGIICTWSSSNETVGTITSTGLFEAHAVGTTTITATNGTIEGTATITVEEEQILSSISLSPYFPALYNGATQQLKATAYDQHANEISNISFVWTSSNESVGTIDLDGLFQALAPGTTEITATNGSINGYTIATVLPIPLTLWGPYVTNTTTTSATINWKTENATTGTVTYANESYYAQYEDYDRAVDAGEEKQLYHLTLNNLTPDTGYHYQVEIENRSTGDCAFRTFPLNGSFTFVVYGDSQEPQGDPNVTQLNRHKLVADRIAGEENVTFVLHLGDLVNDGGNLEEWNRFFEAACAMIATTTFYPILGNHEYTTYSGAGEAVQNYYDAFDVPEWYSFDCGDAHVTVLDSNTDAANMTAQTAWLRNDLATNATWKFVAFHHPPYSSSDKNYGGWTDLRELWSPLLMNNSIAAVFNGHVHAYERLRANDSTYVVTGTGGGPLYDLREPRIPESQASLEDTLGYVKVTVNADHKTASVSFVRVATISNGRITLLEPQSVFEHFDLWSNPALEPLDTGPTSNPYPVISGTHTGNITIRADRDLHVNALYTHPCPGTGGHTEFVRIENSTWNITMNWTGYHGDGHRIKFDAPFTLSAGNTYKYTITTGSYPQILHTRNHTTLDGSLITCTEFVDANNRRYTDWVPALRLEYCE
ncbi:MAG: Ig-like domain-containing protein [Candidatus Methanospirareceae archaeon]